MTSSSKTAGVYTVDEARAAVIAAIPAPLNIEQVPVHEAVGRIAAKDIQATVSIPPFRNSAMDGYAIRYSDYQAKKPLAIAGTSLAGHPFNASVPPESAVKITTGAMVPADTFAISVMMYRRALC